MRIAIVGAGPAGLTAAHRLRAAGHEPTALEAWLVVGGRTHTEHLGADHRSSDGAGWLGEQEQSVIAAAARSGPPGRAD
jgi:phytoene dehydrogenase-like protein